jgi:hypothetical protein
MTEVEWLRDRDILLRAHYIADMNNLGLSESAAEQGWQTIPGHVKNLYSNMSKKCYNSDIPDIMSYPMCMVGTHERDRVLKLHQPAMNEWAAASQFPPDTAKEWLQLRQDVFNSDNYVFNFHDL